MKSARGLLLVVEVFFAWAHKYELENTSTCV